MCKLNDKQLRFAQEYTVDLNATQAAILAGYSTKTAYSQGQRLLKKDEIQDAIREANRKRSEATGITAEWVLTGIAEIATREDARDADKTHRLPRGAERGRTLKAPPVTAGREL